MLESKWRGLPAARRAHEETFLDEIGLVHVFERVAVLGQSRRQRFDADGTAIEALDDGAQESAVAIVQPPKPNVRTYDPTNPDADANGFVNYPNVDIASEMSDMMGAARSYQMDATVAQAAKQQALDAIDLGKA